jgi:hypothetical protein
MTAVRRKMLAREEEALLLCESASDLSQRFVDWSEASGMAETDIISNQLSAVPLPDYRKIRDTERRWDGTNPEIMWHPLMWLPKRLSERRAIRNEETDRVLVEPEEVWTIRVCLELSASGLYDATTGSWLDVLSAVDIDITSDEGRTQVAEWLKGHPDEILDDIDLEDLLLTPEDEDWAFDVAVTIAQDVLYASWGLMANDLLSIASYITEGRVTAHQDARNTFETIVYTGRDVFNNVPNATGAPNSDFWNSVLEVSRNSTSVDEILYGPLIPLEQYLVQIRDQYWPFWEKLPNVLGLNEAPETDNDSE